MEKIPCGILSYDSKRWEGLVFSNYVTTAFAKRAMGSGEELSNNIHVSKREGKSMKLRKILISSNTYLSY